MFYPTEGFQRLRDADHVHSHKICEHCGRKSVLHVVRAFYAHFLDAADWNDRFIVIDKNTAVHSVGALGHLFIQTEIVLPALRLTAQLTDLLVIGVEYQKVLAALVFKNAGLGGNVIFHGDVPVHMVW